MAEKKVLVLITRYPSGDIYASEGLRAAVGLTSGVDEHRVDIAFVGKGCFVARKGVDRRDHQKYIETLKGSGSKFYALKESLNEYSIKEDELEEFVEVIDARKFAQIISVYDHTVDF